MKEAAEKHLQSKNKENEQPVVHQIDKLEDIVMEMLVTADNRYLLLSFKGKPRLELWDLYRTPSPMCVQRYSGYQ